MYQISYNMSRKERYKQLISEITDAKNTLCVADTEKDVYKALKELEKMIADHQYYLPKFANFTPEEWKTKGHEFDNYYLFLDIIEWVQEVQKVINAVQMRDKTRSELVSLLDELLAKANGIVDEENKKELSNKLKTLFNQLAEHSDEIAKIIDLSEIFD